MARFFGRFSGRRVARQCEQLVDESAGFVMGRLPVRLAEDHRPIPTWARINPLAHGDETTLHEIADGKPSDQTFSEREWMRALNYLASEVELSRAHAGVTLLEIQREVLIPLELSLVKEPCDGVGTGPRDVVRSVVHALEKYRSGWLLAKPSPPVSRQDDEDPSRSHRVA
ncbi:MAG TPA: hypothetical protein VFN50_04835 [Acidimicrobiales bacterium]|nr:hypothetical protein [Acidimicrobiales bacterium]